MAAMLMVFGSTLTFPTSVLFFSLLFSGLGAMFSIGLGLRCLALGIALGLGVSSRVKG